jgi:hypothetical protein
MISAYDRFFGGPESVGLGRFATDREGNGLLPFADLVPALSAFGPAALGLSFRALLSEAGRGFDASLAQDLSSGRYAGRGDGFGELSFDPADLSGNELMRANLTPAGRTSSSAFRLGNGALGRGTGFDDGDGFSPVMDASKSRI